MFEVGQKVECVKGIGNAIDHKWSLVIGKVYEISAVETDEKGYVWVGIKGISDESAGWSPGRFVAVESEENNVQEETQKVQTLEAGLRQSQLAL